MALPLALVNASGERRDRSGPVTVTPSDANVDATGDSWRLWKGLGDASLLLSPDGSYDADGAVTPDIVGDVHVVEGQYGSAWEFAADSGRVDFPYVSDIPRGAGTWIFRIEVEDATLNNPMLVYSSAIIIQRTLAYRWQVVNFGGGSLFSGLNAARDVTGSVVIRWDGSRRSFLWPGGGIVDAEQTEPVTVPASLSFSTNNSYSWEGCVEGALFYPVAHSDTEVQRLRDMPRRWEWGPPGTLQIPLAQAPASVIVRSRQAGVSVTEQALMVDGSATFADGTGTLEHADGTLTVGTERESEVMGVIAYPEVVSQAETDRVAAMEHWSWNGIVERVPYILRFTLPEPYVVSRSTLPEPFVISRTTKRE